MHLVPTGKCRLYAHLPSALKATARERYFSVDRDLSFLFDPVTEDFQYNVAPLFGWHINKVYWRGFSHQGDGACFEGDWEPKQVVSVKKVKATMPRENDLHRLIAQFNSLARRSRYQHAQVVQQGVHQHAFSTVFTYHEEAADEQEDQATWVKTFEEASRDLMHWLYAQLESAYAHAATDEGFAELATGYAWRFDEDGDLCSRRRNSRLRAKTSRKN